jgi:hypothetical protein
VDATATYEVFMTDMYGGVGYLRNFGIMSQRVHDSYRRGGSLFFVSLNMGGTSHGWQGQVGCTATVVVTRSYQVAIVKKTLRFPYCHFELGFYFVI